jgi:hypothetical protein
MGEHHGGGYKETGVHQERARTWLDQLEKIERVRDALGFSVDPNIRETVAALNLSGMPTSASCEGHTDRGRGAPWVKVEAPGRPQERYMGEKEIIEMIAQKYGVLADDVRTARNQEAWKEATNLAVDNGETYEYCRWREENKPLREQLGAFLEEFYQGRATEGAAHLKLTSDPEGTFRLHNGGEDFRRSSRALTDDERRRLADRLVEYREEMEAFTEFLKEKYFSSP